MENKKNDIELDELIRSSVKITDKPSIELNNSLKASLYQQEAMIRRQTPVKSISLWYLPMILNFITFGMLAVLSLLVITNPYLSKLMAGICLYISFAGIFITILGIKRTTLKDNITIHIEKRGAAA